MRKPLRQIELLADNPLASGHQHGEMLRQEIHEIAEIRLERMCANPPFRKIKDILELAHAHLPVLESFDTDLFSEFKGIAQGANISEDRLVVLNHYTDLRDIAPDSPKPADECSIIFSPTSNGPILGQTWDIHSSAAPYTILLCKKDVLCFSISGCLGMTGFNNHGVGVAINNLASIDSKIGIIWPALVRKALTRPSASLAKDEIMNAPIGSGRHFAVADGNDFYGIETSGSKKKIITEHNNELYFHTNHCLDEEMRKTHVVRKGSTTFDRYQTLDEEVRHQDLSDAAKVFLALALVSIPENPRDPSDTATCGTFVMDLKKREALACEGTPDEDLLKHPETRVVL